MANKVGLTDAKIAGLKAPATGQIELADGIVPGLRLRMGASGIKTYILRKRVQGKWLNVTIGRHGPSFTLAHARKKARDLLVDVEQGKSIARKPGAKRKGSKGVGTVAELYETYLSQQIEGKKRSAREFDRVFRKYIEPELGDRLADSIIRTLLKAASVLRDGKPLDIPGPDFVRRRLLDKLAGNEIGQLLAEAGLTAA